MTFYTYIYFDESGTPIYVGKGKERRAFQHQRPSEKSAFATAIRNTNPTIAILEADSELSAFEKEKELIRQFGRRDLGTGTLYNRTDGGGGIKRLLRTLEHNRNISASLMGHSVSPQVRKKISDKQRGVQRGPQSPAHKENTSKAKRGRPLSAAHRASLSASKLGKKLPPRSAEHCEKIKAGVRAHLEKKRAAL